MPTSTPRWLPTLALASRLVLGVVWVAAGATKLPDPAASVRAVRAYQLLPEPLVPFAGYGLPALEVVVGVLLLAGLTTRGAAAASAVLLAAFVVGIAVAWARGLTIDCGCFGGGGAVAADQTRYGTEIARDTVLLGASLLLARWPRSRFSLDNALFHPLAPGPAPDPDQEHS